MRKSILSLFVLLLILLPSAQANEEVHCELAPVVVGCQGLQCETIYVGETVAGQVCSEIDGNDLCFYFTTAEGYDFKDLQLWVGDSLAYPQDANGYPDVNCFPYQSGDISGTTDISVCFPLEYLQFVCSEVDQDYYVIAHIDVNSPGGDMVSTWVGNIEIYNEGGGDGDGGDGTGGNGDVDPEDYTGCITWANGLGGITGLTDNNVNAWLNGNTTLCWEVTDHHDGTWTYKYTLDVNDKNISHFDIEVSDSFEESNYLSGPSIEGPDDFGDEGGSSPGIPETFFAIKFTPGEVTYYEAEFDSNRAPTWGDFYAVDGKKPGETQAIWNVGFTSPDSDDPSVTPNGEWDHIVVPDTNTVPSEPNKVAYAFKITIRCDCRGHVDCGKIEIEVDPNDIIKWFNDPNTRWSDGTPGDGLYAGIYGDPNVIPQDDVIYDSNYTEFLDICPCDVSTYGPYEGYDDPSAILLRGSIVDDGGDMCRVAFVIWPEGGTPVMTPWSPAIYETGDVFSWFISGLEPATTYYYQALAKNSVSLAVGSVKYFTTPSF